MSRKLSFFTFNKTDLFIQEFLKASSYKQCLFCYRHHEFMIKYVDINESMLTHAYDSFFYVN
jgi:hypothetical protein